MRSDTVNKLLASGEVKVAKRVTRSIPVDDVRILLTFNRSEDESLRSGLDMRRAILSDKEDSEKEECLRGYRRY